MVHTHTVRLPLGALLLTLHHVWRRCPALSLSHSLELTLNRACFGAAMLPLCCASASAAVRLGTRVERATRSRAAGLALSTMCIVLSLGVFGFLISKVLEPGPTFHPERKGVAVDGLDSATRAIWKWKVVLALNAAAFLVALSRGGGL